MLKIIMAWKTYLVIHFGTAGKRPSEVAKALEAIGFTCALGPVDFIYEWKIRPLKQGVLELADRVAYALRGSGAVFNLDTHD